MINGEQIAQLRTQLRAVNIEYSSLVRANGGKDHFPGKDELRARRAMLMTLIAQAALCVALRVPAAGKVQPDAAIQAA